MSKWQEKGWCPKCKASETVRVFEKNLTVVDIETGRFLTSKPIRAICSNGSCYQLFLFDPATGEITKAKSQSGTGRK